MAYNTPEITYATTIKDLLSIRPLLQSNLFEIVITCVDANLQKDFLKDFKFYISGPVNLYPDETTGTVDLYYQHYASKIPVASINGANQKIVNIPLRISGDFYIYDCLKTFYIYNKTVTGLRTFIDRDYRELSFVMDIRAIDPTCNFINPNKDKNRPLDEIKYSYIWRYNHCLLTDIPEIPEFAYGEASIINGNITILYAYREEISEVTEESLNITLPTVNDNANRLEEVVTTEDMSSALSTAMDMERHYDVDTTFREGSITDQRDLGYTAATGRSAEDVGVEGQVEGTRSVTTDSGITYLRTEKELNEQINFRRDMFDSLYLTGYFSGKTLEELTIELSKRSGEEAAIILQESYALYTSNIEKGIIEEPKPQKPQSEDDKQPQAVYKTLTNNILNDKGKTVGTELHFYKADIHGEMVEITDPLDILKAALSKEKGSPTISALNASGLFAMELKTIQDVEDLKNQLQASENIKQRMAEKELTSFVDRHSSANYALSILTAPLDIQTNDVIHQLNLSNNLQSLQDEKAWLRHNINY